MTFTQSIATCFKKYATFKGRASRSEFWWFQLFQFLISLTYTIIALSLALSGNPFSYSGNILVIDLIFSLIRLVLFLPDIAVTCRRLHDTERSGWWQILPGVTLLIGSILFWVELLYLGDGKFFASITLIAILGAYIRILIWLIDPSDRVENKYGPSPFFDEETELDATTEETDIQSNN